MSKAWSTLRTGAAIVLALAFCLSLVPSLLLGDLSAVLFDSGRMTTLLTNTLVRSGALSTYVVSLLSEKVGGGNGLITCFFLPARKRKRYALNSYSPDHRRCPEG